MKIPIASIEVSSRGRKQFSGLQELANSIKQFGLMHPLVVAPNGEKYELIAGERRLRACVLAGLAEVSVTLYSDTDVITRKEMELEENIKREDLHWSERTSMLAAIHKLKQCQHGEAKARKEGGWSLRDTAELTGKSVGSVSMDLDLNEMMKDKEISKSVKKLPKTAAYQRAKLMVEERVLKQQLSEKKIDISGSFQLGPCQKLIRELDSASIDLVITDPPYDTADIVKAHKAAGSFNGGNFISKTTDCLQALIPEIERVLKPGAHFYFFHAMDQYCLLRKLFAEAGLLVDANPLIWYKKNSTMGMKQFHYMPSYEAISFGMKPPRSRILEKPVHNVLQVASVYHGDRIHQLQKPYELLKILIENSSSIGDTILDCFAGSGATLVAAKRLSRKPIGFELDEANFARAKKWLAEGDQQ